MPPSPISCHAAAQRLRLWLVALFLIAASALPAGAAAQILMKQGGTQSASVRTEHVQAELVAQAPDGVGPGRPLWLGLSITHAPGWHTYWKNSGDSGLPTQLEWKLPPGMDAGEIAWLDAYHAEVRARLSPRVQGAALRWLEDWTRPL